MNYLTYLVFLATLTIPSFAINWSLVAPSNNPFLLSLPNDEFLLAHSDNDLWIRKYDSNLVLQGSAYEVESDDSMLPVMAYRPVGDFILVYGYDDNSNGAFKTVFRRCDYGTLSCDSRVFVNENYDITTNNYGVAVQSTNDFIVSFSYQGIKDFQIRRVSSNLSLQGAGDVQVVGGDNSFERLPKIAVLNDDSVIALYLAPEEDSNDLLRYVHYSADLSTSDPEEDISPPQVPNKYPNIVALADGGFAVSRSSNAGGGIRITRYNSSLQLVCDSQLASDNGNSEFETVLQELSDGRFFGAWRKSGPKFQSFWNTAGADCIREGDQVRIYEEDQDTGNHVMQPQVTQLTSGHIILAYESGFSIHMYEFCSSNSNCPDPTKPVCTVDACSACTDSSECQESKPVCNDVSGECYMPVGFEIDISISQSLSTICANGEVRILTETSHPAFDYDLIAISTPVDTTNANAINSYFSGLGSRIGTIALDLTYLKPDYVYTFTLSHEAGSVSVDFETVPDPLLFFSPSSSTTISIQKHQTIDQTLFTLTQCLPSSSVTKAWSQNSGPTLDLSPYLSNSDRDLTTPACIFESNATYIYKYQVYYDSALDEKDTFTLEIDVTPQDLAVSISGLSEIRADEELELEAEITAGCTVGDIGYFWTCKRAKSSSSQSFTACPNSNDVFEEDSTSTSLQATTINYDAGDYLLIQVTALIDGQEIQSNEFQVFVSSYIDLYLINEDTSCSYQIGSKTDESELGYSKTFSWQQNNPLQSSSLQNSLNSFLQSKTTSTLIIPAEYIEPGTTYEIEVQYTNNWGDIISSSIEVEQESIFPEITFSNGFEQTALDFTTFTLRAQLQCLPGELTTSWLQTSGPDIELSDYISSNKPNEIVFPKCLLIPQSTYVFRYQIESQNHGSESADVEVEVASQKFRLSIAGGDKDHPSTNDLNLTANLVAEGECPFLQSDSLEYTWTCKKALSSISEFSACVDPDSIFGSSSSENQIIIPAEYFEAGNILQIKAVATDGGSLSEEYTSVISVKDANVFGVDLSCESSLSCYVFSPTVSYRFQAELSVPRSSALESFWDVQPLFNITQFINELKTTPVSLNLLSSDYYQTEFVVSYRINNNTHSSVIQYKLPINFPPEGGYLTVTPTSGQTLIDIFKLKASDWSDDNLPLNYQFFHKSSNLPTRRFLNQKSQQKKLSTSIAASGFSEATTSQKVTLIVEVTDAYNSNSTASAKITLLKSRQPMEEQLSQIQEIKEQIENIVDPTQKFNEMQKVMLHLTDMESDVLGDQYEQCDCNNHGSCQKKICVCEEDYTLDHCQMTQSQFDNFLGLKTDILDDLDTTFTEYEELLERMSILEDFTENAKMNTKESIQQSKDVFDRAIQVDDPEVILTEDQVVQASNVYDNMVKFSSETDCEANNSVTIDLKNTTQKYLDKFSDGWLDTKLADQQQQNVVNDLYSMTAGRYTECSILSQVIELDMKSPSLKFNGKESDFDCSKVVELSYFAFQDDLFTCDEEASGGASNQKPIILFQIKDADSGDDITANYGVDITYPKEGNCPSDCSKRGENGCYCDSATSVFDFEGQINKVFSLTNVDKLFTDEILEWTIYDNAQFYFIVGFGLISVGSAILVVKLLSNYCILSKFTKLENPSPFKTFGALFLMVHPYFNALFLGEAPTTKKARVLLFFARTLMLMTLVDITGSNTGLNFGRMRLMQDVELSLDIYILMLPYFTFLPLEALLRLLLSQNKKQGQQISKRRASFLKCIRITGFIFIFLVIAFCIYAILSITESSDSEENKALLSYFGRSLAQDWILTPLIMIIVMLALSDKNSLAVLSHQNQQNEKQKKQQQSQVTPISKSKESKMLPLATEEEGILTSPIQQSCDNLKSEGNIKPENDEQNHTESERSLAPLRRSNSNEKSINPSDEKSISPNNHTQEETKKEGEKPCDLSNELGLQSQSELNSSQKNELLIKARDSNENLKKEFSLNLDVDQLQLFNSDNKALLKKHQTTNEIKIE